MYWNSRGLTAWPSGRSAARRTKAGIKCRPLGRGHRTIVREGDSSGLEPQSAASGECGTQGRGKCPSRAGSGMAQSGARALQRGYAGKSHANVAGEKHGRHLSSDTLSGQEEGRRRDRGRRRRCRSRRLAPVPRRVSARGENRLLSGSDSGTCRSRGCRFDRGRGCCGGCGNETQPGRRDSAARVSPH